ncbi:MAG: hypothetical protein PWP60_672 [Candidatus Atribacteria bacterium]|jgi:ABC-type maltose transport system permease subunit|nr:hypothetical protein [Candidatus Atribacteria bacterium]
MAGTFFKLRSKTSKVLIYTVLLVWLIFALFPIYYNFITSFKRTRNGLHHDTQIFSFYRL